MSLSASVSYLGGDVVPPPVNIYGVDISQFGLDFAGGEEIENGFAGEGSHVLVSPRARRSAHTRTAHSPASATRVHACRRQHTRTHRQNTHTISSPDDTVFLIVFGTLLVFLGTRIFKPALVLITFVLGLGATFAMVRTQTDDQQAALIAACVVGLLCAITVMKVWSLGVFMIGVGTGFVIWVCITSLFDFLQSDVALYGLLSGLCLVCGGLALMAERVWILIGTAVVGAFLMAEGIDHFVSTDLNVFMIISHRDSCDNDQCYVLYSSVGLTAAVGMWVQYRFTSHWGKERRLKEAAKEGKRAKKEKKNRGHIGDSSSSDDDDEDRLLQERQRRKRDKQRGGGGGGKRGSAVPLRPMAQRRDSYGDDDVDEENWGQQNRSDNQQFQTKRVSTRNSDAGRGASRGSKYAATAQDDDIETGDGGAAGAPAAEVDEESWGQPDLR
jgi:hypothetical protein